MDSPQTLKYHSPYFSPNKSRFFKIQSSIRHDDRIDSMKNTYGTETLNMRSEDPSLHRKLALVKPTLIQECLADDPWKLLVAVTLLNKTTAKLAIPVFWDLMTKWPTPWALSRVGPAELAAKIRFLGTQNIRSRRLIKLSEAYLQDPPNIHDLRPSAPRVVSNDPKLLTKRKRYPPTPVSHLPGTGQYALDSYRIFCTQKNPVSANEWKLVMPSDKELIRYLKWKWAFAERKEWAPGVGTVGFVTASYLENLIEELQT